MHALQDHSNLINNTPQFVSHTNALLGTMSLTVIIYLLMHFTMFPSIELQFHSLPCLHCHVCSVCPSALLLCFIYMCAILCTVSSILFGLYLHKLYFDAYFIWLPALLINAIFFPTLCMLLYAGLVYSWLLLLHFILSHFVVETIL